MENRELQNKIDALMNEDRFMQALTEASDAREVKALFAAEDVELTDDLAEDLFSGIGKTLRGEQADDELCEEDLESVAGGANVRAVIAGYLCAKLLKWMKEQEEKRKKEIQDMLNKNKPKPNPFPPKPHP